MMLLDFQSQPGQTSKELSKAAAPPIHRICSFRPRSHCSRAPLAATNVLFKFTPSSAADGAVSSVSNSTAVTDCNYGQDHIVPSFPKLTSISMQAALHLEVFWGG